MNIDRATAIQSRSRSAAATGKGRRASHGSAQTKTFVAELSDTNFKLTPEEEAHLDNLIAWQERSTKSTIRLGGTGEAPNAAMSDGEKNL